MIKLLRDKFNWYPEDNDDYTDLVKFIESKIRIKVEALEREKERKSAEEKKAEKEKRAMKEKHAAQNDPAQKASKPSGRIPRAATG